MKTVLAGTALATLLMLQPALAQTGQRAPDKLTSSDRQFLKKAAGGGIGEVRLGELAEQKANSPDVKQFGRHMVDDHSKANDALKSAMGQRGVTVPEAIDPEAHKSYDKLSKLSGAQFDRAYVQDMLKDHRKDVKLFQDQAKNGRDPTLRQFAQQTLPTLQEHLQAIERLSKSSAAQR